MPTWYKYPYLNLLYGLKSPCVKREARLSSGGLAGRWSDIFGPPLKVHIDNGKSFPSLCDRDTCVTLICILLRSDLAYTACSQTEIVIQRSKIPPLAITAHSREGSFPGSQRPGPRFPGHRPVTTHSPPRHWEKPSRPHTLSRSLDTSLPTCK